MTSKCELLFREVDKMKKLFYNEMAVKIQTRWRGYYTRKYIHNFKARREYLEVRFSSLIYFYRNQSSNFTK